MTFEPSKFSHTTFGAPARRSLQSQHSLVQMSTKSAPSMQMAPIAKQPADQQLAAQFAQHQLANANHQNQVQIQSNSNVNANPNHSLSRFPMNLPTVVANNRHVFAHSHSSTTNTPKIQSPSSEPSTLSSSFAQFQRQIQQQPINAEQPFVADNNLTARTFKTLLDSSFDSQNDDNSDAIGIESDQAAIASLSNKPPTPSPPVKKRPHQQQPPPPQDQFTDENENNAVTNEVGAMSTYDELRRDEAALWSMLSATYAQCRAIEQQLSECHNRLQRHAATNAAKRRRAHRRS